MATYEMGEFIRQLRMERGIMQKQLCDGLCSPSTLSKIEKGQHTPSGGLFRKLMERLGNYFGRYYSVFLDKHEFEAWRKMEDINRAIVMNNIALADELLAEYQGMDDFKNGFGKQFVLNCKIGIAFLKEERDAIQSGKSGNDYITDADYKEWVHMAHESIRITIPGFDPQKVSTYMLSYEELRAINSLSIAYIYSNEYEMAIQLLRAIAESLDNFCPDAGEKARFYPAILVNLVEALYATKQYDKAIDICVKGWEFCVEFSRTIELAAFMYGHGRSLVGKGEKEKGRELLRHAYIVAQSNCTNAVLADIDSFFMESFGELPEHCHVYPPTGKI